MGSTVSGFFGGNTPSAPNVQVWQPQYTNPADTQAYSSISNINQNNPFYQYQPQYQGVLNSALNNPYAAPAQTAANTAGTAYGTAGAQGGAGATALNSGAMSLLPYISSVMNTAMDPQSALYNQNLTKATDASNVNNAQYGITGPMAAGNTNQAITNFNIDWANNNLARQLQGLQGAGAGLSNAGSALTTGLNLGTGSAGATNTGGQVPLTAFNTNLSNIQSALNNYGQSQVAGNQNTQTAVSDLLNYLGLGAKQSDAQAQYSIQNYGNQLDAANAQNDVLGNLINSGFGSLGAIGSGLNLANNANASTSDWLNFFSGAGV